MIKKIIIFAIILLGIGFLYSFSQQIVNSLQANNRLDQITGEVITLQKKNLELQKRLTEVNSNQYIEEQARDKLNFSRPDETVFLIPEGELKKILGVKKEEVKEKILNYLGWFKLFWK